MDRARGCEPRDSLQRAESSTRHSLSRAVDGRLRDRERMRSERISTSAVLLLEGAPTGGGRARPARRIDLESLPAAQVCTTDRYVKESAQDVGAEGECA